MFKLNTGTATPSEAAQQNRSIPAHWARGSVFRTLPCITKVFSSFRCAARVSFLSLLTAFVTFEAGCLGPGAVFGMPYYAEYGFRGVATRRAAESADPPTSIGPGRFGKAGNSFEDNFCRFGWNIGRDGYGVEVNLTNLTDVPVIIPAPVCDAAFVGASSNGYELEITPGGKIAPHSKARISLSRTKSSNYDETQVFPTRHGATREECTEKSHGLLGQSIVFLLPVQVGSEMYEYRFTFTCDEVRCRSKW